MSWLSTSDLESRLGHSKLLDLADDDNDGTPDTDVMAAVRADAEAAVEARLAGRYAVPLASADPAAVSIAAAFAIHRLYLRRHADSPQHVKEAFESARAQLERIACGEADLITITPRGDRARGNRTCDERVFTSETLEDY